MLSSVHASPVKQTSQAAPLTRLIVTQIVVENFKSYAGRHTIGPFHKVIHHLISLLPHLVIHLHSGSKWIRQIQCH